MSQLTVQPFQADDTDHDTEHETENRQLLIDSRRFAKENRWTSWWQLSLTLVLLLGLVCTVGFSASLLVRLACSFLIALTIVRMFIVYHDYMHNAILKGSPLASLILRLYGHLMLTPPTVWRRSHDHHHHHNSKLFGASIGSFPIMTKAGYLSATRREQLEYRMARSPLVIVFGYFTVFLFGMCIFPLLYDFRKNVSALTTLLVHFGTLAAGIYWFGFTFTCFAFVLPTFLAMQVGAYLFYVQHNFPAAEIRGRQDWSYADAALISSSYLETGAVLQWFLGNIGYHHVHHLNSKIPFYRLPEAMRALPGLQAPGRTSFALKDIAACLRLKLWDSDRNQLVPFPASRRSVESTVAEAA